MEKSSRGNRKEGRREGEDCLRTYSRKGGMQSKKKVEEGEGRVAEEKRWERGGRMGGW